MFKVFKLSSCQLDNQITVVVNQVLSEKNGVLQEKSLKKKKTTPTKN